MITGLEPEGSPPALFFHHPTHGQQEFESLIRGANPQLTSLVLAWRSPFNSALFIISTALAVCSTATFCRHIEDELPSSNYELPCGILRHLVVFSLLSLYLTRMTQKQRPLIQAAVLRQMRTPSFRSALRSPQSLDIPLIAVRMSAFVVGSLTPSKYSLVSSKKAGSSSVARIVRNAPASGVWLKSHSICLSTGIGFMPTRVVLPALRR